MSKIKTNPQLLDDLELFDAKLPKQPWKLEDGTTGIFELDDISGKIIFKPIDPSAFDRLMPFDNPGEISKELKERCIGYRADLDKTNAVGVASTPVKGTMQNLKPIFDRYVGGIDPYKKEVDEIEAIVKSSAIGPYGADLIDPFKVPLHKQMGDKLAQSFLEGVKEYAMNPYIHHEEEKPICYVGIDPGLNGGVVAMTQVKLIGKWIMPLADKEVDIAGLYGLFKDLMANYRLVVILEDVHSIYGVSASANYTFGFVCGAIEAVVVSHQLKLIKVQPKKWQAEIWANGDKVYKPKKPEQKNPSIDTKATSLKAAVRLFPSLDLRKSARAKNFHDGIVDSLLLSEYGRRKNL